MLFFTVVLLTYHLYFIVRSDALNKEIFQVAELKLDQLVGIISEEEFNKKVLKITVLPFIMLMILFISEITYLFKAFNTDVYLYPTLFVMFLFIFSHIFKNKNKDNSIDLTTKEKLEEYRKKTSNKRKIRPFIYNTIFVCYYSYMIYLLVFLAR